MAVFFRPNEFRWFLERFSPPPSGDYTPNETFSVPSYSGNRSVSPFRAQGKRIRSPVS